MPKQQLNCRQKVLPGKHSNQDVEAILERVDKIEQSYAPFLMEKPRSIDLSRFRTHLNNFDVCMEESSKTPRYCKELVARINSAYLTREPSLSELMFRHSYDTFVETKNSVQPAKAIQAYLAKDITPLELFVKLEGLRLAYKEMKKELIEIASEKITQQSIDKERPILSKYQRPLKYMSDNFEGAYADISKEVFEDLRKDAIRLKLAKIRIASRLVADNGTALPPGYADAFLRRMRDKLVCLTEYAVGPKFDEQAPGPLRRPWLEKNK